MSTRSVSGGFGAREFLLLDATTGFARVLVARLVERLRGGVLITVLGGAGVFGVGSLGRLFLGIALSLPLLRAQSSRVRAGPVAWA